MKVDDWIGRNWPNTITVGCIVIAGLIEAWQQAASGVPQNSPIPRLEGWWHYAPVTLLLAAGIVWLIGYFRKGAEQPPAQAIQPVRALVPGIPTFSSLQGTVPDITFDPKEFFQFAYYSQLTAEVENNIKIVAHRCEPTDVEAFYARLIGIGLVRYSHDITWAYIFKSQLLLLAEMNAKVTTPLANAKHFYDHAAADSPQQYSHYPFEKWLQFLKKEQLIVHHASEMLEITHRGRDFLKYLAGGLTSR